MGSILKWLMPIIMVLVVMFVFTSRGMVQNVTTKTTSDVELMSDVVNLGVIRDSLGELPDTLEYIDKEELETNLLYKIATEQTNHNYDLEINYVYLDKDGKVTTDDKNIMGVQFEVYYTKDGKIYSSSSKRIKLDKIN